MLRSLRKKQVRRSKTASHLTCVVGGCRRSYLVALAVSMVVLTACVTSVTGRSQLRLYSEDFMSSLGTRSFDGIKDQKEIEKNALVNGYVRCVADRIIRALPPELDMHHPEQWEVRVFKDDDANAFALPGKKIGVNTGMLRVAKTPHQLAAVVGHEIAHVIAQHGNERLSQSHLSFAGLTIAGLLADSQHRDLLMSALGLGTTVGVLLPFSRLHESEADHYGLFYSARAGFDPRAAAQLWKNMQEESKSSVPVFLSTHPSHQGRIDALNALQEQAMPLYREAQKRVSHQGCTAPRN